MNNSPLKARDIEALTFIYSATGPMTPAERKRPSRFFNWAWLKLRKRPARPLPTVG